MVDGVTALNADRDRAFAAMQAATQIAGSDIVIQVEPSDGNGLAHYRAFSRDAVSGIAQLPIWVETWVETVNPDGLIVSLRGDSGPAASLPLEVVRQGGLRVARFMGGSHANGNFPATARDSAGASLPDLRDALRAAVSRARPDIDLISLERQLRSVDGVSNPLSTMPSVESADLALATDLTEGFENLLDRHNGKRRRKKHRLQTRKFEEAGGYRRIVAGTPEEVDRLLTTFFTLKSARLREMGLADAFADPAQRSFFRTLFVASLESRPQPFMLEGLEIGGVLRAITGSAQTSGRIVCEFGAIADDDFAKHSPGEFLFYENIREACGSGLSIFDFSVGDEAYKRMWCEIEIRHFDNLVPLTAKGRVHAAMRAAVIHAKRRIKSTPVLRDMVRRMRMHKASSADD